MVSRLNYNPLATRKKLSLRLGDSSFNSKKNLEIKWLEGWLHSFFDPPPYFQGRKMLVSGRVLLFTNFLDTFSAATQPTIYVSSAAQLPLEINVTVPALLRNPTTGFQKQLRPAVSPSKRKWYSPEVEQFAPEKWWLKNHRFFLGEKVTFQGLFAVKLQGYKNLPNLNFWPQSYPERVRLPTRSCSKFCQHFLYQQRCSFKAFKAKRISMNFHYIVCNFWAPLKSRVLSLTPNHLFVMENEGKTIIYTLDVSELRSKTCWILARIRFKAP